METDVRQLALDTLHNRNEENAVRSKSCFIFNEAGEKLLACEPSAIPVLEELMWEVIVPAMENHREQNGVPDWSSMFHEGPPFAGLSEFLGAYWIICARSDPSHAVEFMCKMIRPVVNESVSLLSVYFNSTNSLSDVAIPMEYVEYVNRLSDSDIDEFRDVARYVIERLGLNDSATS